MKLGRNLLLGVIEIGKAPITQVEIVRLTREGIQAGKTLREIKRQPRLKKGDMAPNSAEYADSIIDHRSAAHTFSLTEPLCAVFVRLKRWQIEDSP